MIRKCLSPRTEFMLKPTPRVYEPAAQGVCKSTLRELFDSQESPLLRYAFSLVGRRAVAEEIVQDAFLQLHVRWDEVDSPQEWLFRTVRNRAYNYCRDNKRVVLNKDDQPMPTANIEDETPEAMMLRMEAAGALRQIIQELSESDRRLIELKYFDGLKYRDIAEQTGLSIGNVGYRLHHILKELAGKLRPLGIDGES